MSWLDTQSFSPTPINLWYIDLKGECNHYYWIDKLRYQDFLLKEPNEFVRTISSEVLGMYTTTLVHLQRHNSVISFAQRSNNKIYTIINNSNGFSKKKSLWEWGIALCGYTRSSSFLTSWFYLSAWNRCTCKNQTLCAFTCQCMKHRRFPDLHEHCRSWC